MKMPAALIAVLLSAVLVSAAEPPEPSPEASPSPRMSRVLRGEVVASDAAARTITYRMSGGEEKTATVGDKAAAKLKEIEPGDKVTLTLRESDGEQTVVALKKK
jgi:hypothetical protein